MELESTPVQKIRSPHERFQWSIDKLRLSFRIVGQDIFRSDFQRCRWFYALTMFWIMAITLQILTLLDFDNCVGAMRYCCLLVTSGNIEVTEISSPQIE